MKLAKAMVTVAGMTGLSRIAGFVRDILTAAFLGAGPVADAFFIALKLPNFFRRVTAEGAFSIAFVPLYSRTLQTEGKDEANRFASNAFMIMLCVLSVFTLLVMIFMPYVIMVITPGFIGDALRQPMAVEFSRITFPYLLLMSLTALLGGVLNAHDRFAPFAFAPVLFNVSLIVALLVSGYFENAGYAMSWGILVAGILQLLFLWVAAFRNNVRITFKKPILDAKTKRVFRLMGPAMIGAGVMHINLFADLIIASLLEEGAISYLYYADRLNQLPLGVVGIAVGTALLPMLARAMELEDKSQSRNLFNRALEYCLLLALPAAVALAAIPLPLITVLFERGAFMASDSLMTASVLMAYAMGLPAYIAIKVFSTAHWAREDTVTPVKISVVATILNIVMSIALIQYIGVVGIALATGIAGWVQFFAHIHYLKDHSSAQLDAQFKFVVVKIIISSLIMGASLYGAAFILHDYIFSAFFLTRITALGGLVIFGILIYGTLILGLKVVKLSDIKRHLLKKGT
ncbi:MAG: murein biosynthesis integral membrane protein MurJ [Alphaproteobacteria bacterium]|nr:murein biosynthesis integral membrane protein MurJ [Alphaproteobacteria bacterium]